MVNVAAVKFRRKMTDSGI